MTKELHIVFQVMNYVFAPVSQDHRLLPVHRLLLIALAKHHGVKGIYPSTTTLAKELNVSPRYIKTCLNYLESQHILKIERKNGRSNHYFLEFLSTDRGTTDHQCTSDHRGTTDHPTGELQIRDRGTTDHPINTNNQFKRNNTERERKNRARPLSEDFDITDETLDYVKSTGLTKPEALHEHEKFMNHYLGTGEKQMNWQFTYRKWMLQAVEHKEKYPAKQKEEPRSTVPWYNPSDGQRGSQPVATLLSGLVTEAKKHINPQGGSPNGLGKDLQGKKPKT